MSHVGPGPCDTALAASSSRSAIASRPRTVLAATIFGSSLAFIDGSVVNVALPALAQDLSVRPNAMAWAINAYLLPLGALILLGGAIGDRYGRRWSFVTGIALFLVASVACALAPSYGAFLAGRGIQGVGAALLMPNSLAILGSAFHGDERGRAIGTWAAVGAIAGALGPLLGGWLVDIAGWRWIFAVNLPIGVGAVWLALVGVPRERQARKHPSLDWLGAITVTFGLGLVAWALSEASDRGASGAAVLGAGMIGVAMLGTFAVLERRAGAAALTPPALFASRASIALTAFTFLLYAALGGLFVLVPFMLVNTSGWSAVSAGAALLPLPIVIGVGSRVMGGLASRLGGRWPLTAGAAIVAVGFALLARVGPTEIDFWREMLPATIVIAVGMAVCVAPLTAAVMASVDNEHVGVASGFNSAMARVGGLIATALLGFIFVEQGTASAAIAGFRAAAVVGCGLAIASSALVWWLLQEPARGNIE